MDSPLASYVFSNFSRAASFGILFILSRILSSEEMATIFLSKNVANAVVLSCSFGVHISYLRDKQIDSIRASKSLLSIIVVLEMLLVFVGWIDWSLIFFTLTAYYALVLPSVPKETGMNLIGIIVLIVTSAIVIFFNEISLLLLFISGSVVLVLPLFYSGDFMKIRNLLRNNNALFVGELAPFIFGLLFVPSMLWLRGVDTVNAYGRIMMFVNIVLFPINGLKYLLFSRLKSGQDVRLLSFIYLGMGILGGSILYLFKEFFGELNKIVIVRYLWPIFFLILSKISSDWFQQKSYIQSPDKSRNFIIYIGYAFRFSVLLSSSLKYFVIALCGVELLIFIMFYVLDIYHSDDNNILSI